jgi:hypothetical protein
MTKHEQDRYVIRVTPKKLPHEVFEYMGTMHHQYPYFSSKLVSGIQYVSPEVARYAITLMKHCLLFRHRFIKDSKELLLGLDSSDLEFKVVKIKV